MVESKSDEGAKILQFPVKPRAAPRDPLESRGAVKLLGPEAVIILLEGLAPVTDSLRTSLALPGGVYLVGKGPSLSSEPEKDISELALQLNSGQEPKAETLKDAPDYALHITNRGSSSFCALLDKRRKILVFGSLGNALGAELSWDAFEMMIQNALKTKEGEERGGKSFGLVYNGKTLTL